MKRSLRPDLAAVLFFLLDAALLCITAAHHTFWRDETLSYLLARQSTSVPDVIRNLHYEAHPPLWHLVLYLVTRFSWNPEWMKLPHLLFALTAAALVLFFRRLPLPLRLGIAFSYFFLFEYGVINRNYTQGLALLLAATILVIGKSPQRSWTIPLLLSLAALSSLPALVLAVVLFSVYLWCDLAVRPTTSPRLPAYLVIGSIAFGICVLTSVILIHPPADSGLYLVGKRNAHGIGGNLLNCGRFLAKTFLPIPTSYRFWERTYFDVILPHHLSSILAALVGWPLWIGLALYFKRPVARYFFIAGSLILLLQLSISGRAFMHHLGWLFICLALALFLEYGAPDAESSTLQKRSAWQHCLLTVVLVTQVVVGLLAFTVSLYVPFSASRQVADFLRIQHLKDGPLYFEPDYISSSVIAYLQRPSYYDLELHRQLAFPLWTREQFLNQHIPTRAELDQANGSAGPPVLITDVPLTPAQQAELGMHLLAAFDQSVASISALDSYYIYR